MLRYTPIVGGDRALHTNATILFAISPLLFSVSRAYETMYWIHVVGNPVEGAFSSPLTALFRANLPSIWSHCCELTRLSNAN